LKSPSPHTILPPHLAIKRIRVAQFGLGPIGLETLKFAASKPWAEVVGGVDIDPSKIGRDLSDSDLTGLKSLRGRKVYRSLAELPRQPDVVFHTAVSKFKHAYSQIEPIARLGISVVSSCEELLFPALRKPALAKRLDQLCRKTGARVIGTGVNPGFVMDFLPVCLTGVSRSVDAVHVQRVVNASTRREPLQRKIGSGLLPAEFRRRFKAGQAGHAGLKESLALIAHALVAPKRRRPTRPSGAARERRLTEKRKLSQRKQQRGRPGDD